MLTHSAGQCFEEFGREVKLAGIFPAICSHSPIYQPGLNLFRFHTTENCRNRRKRTGRIRAKIKPCLAHSVSNISNGHPIPLSRFQGGADSIGKSFTADLVQFLKNLYPLNCQISYVIGAHIRGGSDKLLCLHDFTVDGFPVAVKLVQLREPIRYGRHVVCNVHNQDSRQCL